MLISISDAGRQLDDLVSEVEAGGDVVLMRQGRPVARLVVVSAPSIDSTSRRAVLEAARAQARDAATDGDTAARSQDFLYADDGIPA